MAINRFSRGPIPADVQSEYIPMPVDIINQQLQTRQQTYDVTKQFIEGARESVYGAKALDVDTDTLNQIVSEYDNEIAKTVESVGGDYSRLKSYADALGNKIKRDLHQGRLGAINNNYLKAQAHLQELNKLKKEGKISEAGYRKGLHSISAFSGTQETESGFSSPELYIPTKYIDIGKIADEYGSKIRDQYDRLGRKYINGAKATELIEQNLWNNSQVIENAREEVWAMYGDMPDQKEKEMLEAYIHKLAKDSGYKLQFQQIMTPEGEDALTGGKTYTYDLTGAKPVGGLINLMGTDYKEDLTQIKNKRIEKNFVKAYKFFKYATFPKGIRDAQLQLTELEYTKKANDLAKKLAKKDIIVDLASANNIDLTNPTEETFYQLEEAINSFNNSTANSRITTVNNKKTAEKFKEAINNGSILSLPIIDAETGEELSIEEKEAMLKTHLDSNGKNEGAIIYGGEVVDVGQPVPVGTWVGVYNTPENRELFGGKGGNVKRIFIDANQNKLSPVYIQDRVIAASKSGFASYKLPDGTNVQLLRLGDGSVKQYINGQEAKNENGNPVIYQLTQ